MGRRRLKGSRAPLPTHLDLFGLPLAAVLQHLDSSGKAAFFAVSKAAAKAVLEASKAVTLNCFTATPFTKWVLRHCSSEVNLCIEDNHERVISQLHGKPENTNPLAQVTSLTLKDVSSATPIPHYLANVSFPALTTLCLDDFKLNLRCVGQEMPPGSLPGLKTLDLKLLNPARVAPRMSEADEQMVKQRWQAAISRLTSLTTLSLESHLQLLITQVPSTPTALTLYPVWTTAVDRIGAALATASNLRVLELYRSFSYGLHAQMDCNSLVCRLQLHCPLLERLEIPAAIITLDGLRALMSLPHLTHVRVATISIGSTATPDLEHQLLNLRDIPCSWHSLELTHIQPACTEQPNAAGASPLALMHPILALPLRSLRSPLIMQAPPRPRIACSMGANGKSIPLSPHMIVPETLVRLVASGSLARDLSSIQLAAADMAGGGHVKLVGGTLKLECHPVITYDNQQTTDLLRTLGSCFQEPPSLMLEGLTITPRVLECVLEVWCREHLRYLSLVQVQLTEAAWTALLQLIPRLPHLRQLWIQSQHKCEDHTAVELCKALQTRPRLVLYVMHKYGPGTYVGSLCEQLEQLADGLEVQPLINRGPSGFRAVYRRTDPAV